MSEEGKTRITSVKGPPRSGDEPACLVLIYPSGPMMGRRYTLDGDALIIGRGSDCDIVVDLDSVSRRHATIERKGGSILISDLGSTNGTYVNEQLVEEQPLRDGDQVKIGNAIFKFLSGGNVESGYHEAIFRMTIIDGLTEAHNKRYFLEFLDRELARCVRYGRPLSIVMFDLDHFKAVNDTHGHLAGDYVLRELSRRLRARIRKEELMARYGGEEFVVVLPEAGHEGAMQFAEQIRRLVEREPFEFEGETIPMTISVGVATIQGELVETPQFIKIVDQNLYQAKRSGRNQVVG
jgi:two-component system, cell cycle response regulator